MTRAAVDYENLLDTSFSDANQAVRTGVRPRWERKKHEQQQQQQQQQKMMKQQHPVSKGVVVHARREPLSTTAHSNGASISSSSSGVGLVGSISIVGSSGEFGTGDRFIPSRAGMNMDLSKHLIESCTINGSTAADEEASSNSPAANPSPSSQNEQGGGGSENSDTTVLSHEQKSISDAVKVVYKSNLSSALLGVEDLNDKRVMAYKEKAPAPKGDTINNLNVLYSVAAATNKKMSSNTKLVSRQIPSAPSRILDAPDLMDDYYLNLVSWSDTNVVAVALGQTVYLWNAGTGDIQELCTFEDGPNAHISSVQWVQQGGAHVAVGVSNGMTQLWDVQQCKQLRGMDGHSDRIGALAWNRHILTSASRDTTILNHDVRVARHVVGRMHHHTQEVCGVAWSPDGETLASGGNDNLLCLWDAASTTTGAASGSSSGRQDAPTTTTPRFRFTDHQAAVKALAWSPHENNLLATGGGTADRTIKFWNARTGSLLNSIDTGSQVCALQWNPYEKEILSSHGFARNQLCLWKYPSMAKIKELEGHTARVLHLAVSPTTGTVLSAAADETLRFWDIFSTATTGKGGGAGDVAGGRAGGGAADPFKSSSSAKTSWTTQIR
jgi:cell division cycle 20, cofactor of APC complex